MTRRHRTLLAALLVSTVGFGSAACAYDSYPYRGNGAHDRGVDRRAYDTGHRDGLEAGRSDARHRIRYDPTAWRSFQDPGRGSNGRNADRDDRYGRDGRNGRNGRNDGRDDFARDYRQGFRQGYEEGYRAGGRARR